MMDITETFKSTIKMVKVRQKSSSLDLHGANGKQDLLKKRTFPEDFDIEFNKKSKELVRNVSELKAFLLKNRKAYLAASSVVMRTGQIRLTDIERDQIDNESMNYIKLCRDMLAKLKESEKQTVMSRQIKSHRTTVLYLIEEYLKAVCELYSEQKAIRVKRAVDRQIMSKLSIAPKDRSTRPSAGGDTSRRNSEADKKRQVNKKTDTAFDEESSSETESRPASEISAQEAQMFKEENEQLYNQLNSTVEEVQSIEGKVVEISRLQSIFTEKVLEQSVAVDQINEQLVTSTENIVTGNKDIREAMMNNAGLRVWLIFGICVLSFTLLFLDWYND